MDAEEEESRSKRLEEEQDSATAFDAPQELPFTAQECDTELKDLPDRGEMAAAPPVTASGEEEKVVIAGELSTSMKNRDEAEAVKEKDDSVEEMADMKGVVSEEVGVAFKKKEEEITDEDCEMDVIEVKNKVVDLYNVTPAVKVEDSVVLKAEAAEKENDDICMPDTVEEKAVPIDEFGMEDANMKVNDGVEKRELADETDVADMAVGTKQAEEEEDGAAMPHKAVESEKVVGTEMADTADVLVTRSEAIEVDGVGMEDNSREIDDKVEVPEEVNVGGMVDATAEERADGDGAEEEAEETEAANEADFASGEADVADMTEDIEAVEEIEEMEVAEDQSRSVSAGKRKRGKNPKSTGRVPAWKKLEEDVCFICFDGGDLVLCDRR